MTLYNTIQIAKVVVAKTNTLVMVLINSILGISKVVLLAIFILASKRSLPQFPNKVSIGCNTLSTLSFTPSKTLEIASPAELKISDPVSFIWSITSILHYTTNRSTNLPLSYFFVVLHNYKYSTNVFNILLLFASYYPYNLISQIIIPINL